MQLVEIVLSGERKRSDNAYGSDSAFASCKVAVHPGDVLEDVIRAARDVVEQALDVSGIPGPKATPAAKTPPSPAAPTEAQMKFLRDLARRLEEDVQVPKTREEASALIEELKQRVYDADVGGDYS